MFLRNFSLLLALTFSTNVYANTGAGVIPFFDDGTVLLGKGKRQPGKKVKGVSWSDFGGKQNPNETLAQTAFRKFKEQTGHYSFPQVTLNHVMNAPYVEHINRKTGLPYREYLLHISGKKPTLPEIRNNAKIAQAKLGANAHVEKIDWGYFYSSILLNAANNKNRHIPGVPDKLYRPFLQVLKKQGTKKVLAQFMAKENMPKPAPVIVQKPIVLAPQVVKVVMRPVPVVPFRPVVFAPRAVRPVPVIVVPPPHVRAAQLRAIQLREAQVRAAHARAAQARAAQMRAAQIRAAQARAAQMRAAQIRAAQVRAAQAEQARFRQIQAQRMAQLRFRQSQAQRMAYARNQQQFWARRPVPMYQAPMWGRFARGY